MFFKISVGFVLSNCLNAKKKHLECEIIPIIQYSIELSVHKQPSVFNTTYTIQSRVNCPNISQRYSSVYAIIFVGRNDKFINFSLIFLKKFLLKFQTYSSHTKG